MNVVSEFNHLDIIGCVLIALCSSFAAAIGMGGGSLFIPISLLLMSYTPHGATALSQWCMAGAAISTFCVNVYARHPTADRPLLNMDLMLFMSPMQLAGTVLGVVVNRLVPAEAIVALTLTVMICSNSNSVVKAIRIRKAEQEANKAKIKSVETEASCEQLEDKAELQKAGVQQESGNIDKQHPSNECETKIEPNEGVLECVKTDSTDAAAQADTTTEAEPLKDAVIDGSKAAAVEVVGIKDAAVAIKNQKEETMPIDGEKQQVNKEVNQGRRNPFDRFFASKTLEEFIEREKKQSAIEYTMLASLWILNFVFSFLRGSGDGSLNLVVACSFGYWLLIVVNAAILLIFAAAWFAYANARWHRKMVVGYYFLKNDPTFTLTAASFLGMSAFGAGFYGGITGLGGSVLAVPALLYFSILPQTISSLNATLVLISSSAASVIYLTTGVVLPDVGGLLASICFIFSLIGTILLNSYVKKNKSQSSILFMYVICLTSAILLTSGTTIYKIIIGEAEAGGVELLCGTPEIVDDTIA